MNGVAGGSWTVQPPRIQPTPAMPLPARSDPPGHGASPSAAGVELSMSVAAASPGATPAAANGLPSMYAHVANGVKYAAFNEAGPLKSLPMGDSLAASNSSTPITATPSPRRSGRASPHREHQIAVHRAPPSLHETSDVVYQPLPTAISAQPRVSSDEVERPTPAAGSSVRPIPSPSRKDITPADEHHPSSDDEGTLDEAARISRVQASPVPALRNLEALAETFSERKRGSNRALLETTSAFGRDIVLTVQKPANSRLTSIIVTKDSLAAQAAAQTRESSDDLSAFVHKPNYSPSNKGKRDLTVTLTPASPLQSNGKTRARGLTNSSDHILPASSPAPSRPVDPDQDVQISPWTLRYVAVEAQLEGDNTVRPVQVNGKDGRSTSCDGGGAASQAARARAAALEHSYLLQYFSTNLVEIQRSMFAAIIVWLLFIINDAFKETQGLRRNFSAIVALRILDSLIGLILIGVFQTSMFQIHRIKHERQDKAGVSVDSAGMIAETLYPLPEKASGWKEAWKLRKKYAVKYVEELMFLVLYLFGISQILFGLWQNDSFDPTYSLIIILLPSMCATFFRQRFLFTVVYSTVLLCTFMVLTGAFLNDLDEQRGDALAQQEGAQSSAKDTVSSTYQFAETVIGLSSCICIFTFFAYRKERLLRQDFLAGVRLASEEKKSLHLLAKMLPLSVISQLKLGDEFIYEHHPSISILFSHIAHFDVITALSVAPWQCTAAAADKCLHILHPIDLISLLNNLFGRFDDLSDEFKVYKVETIGDCYLVASGCPREYARDDHAAALSAMALDVRALVAEEFQMAELLEIDSSLTIGLQIGIHSGSIIAGVVGVSYPRFRLMGDTINCASRMSTTCSKGSIQLSSASFELLPRDTFQTEPRGEVQVKGKGLMATYYLHSQRFGITASSTLAARKERRRTGGGINVPRKSIVGTGPGGAYTARSFHQQQQSTPTDFTPKAGGGLDTPMSDHHQPFSIPHHPNFSMPTQHQTINVPQSQKDDSTHNNVPTAVPSALSLRSKTISTLSPPTTSPPSQTTTLALQEAIKLKSRSMLAAVHPGDASPSSPNAGNRTASFSIPHAVISDENGIAVTGSPELRSSTPSNATRISIAPMALGGSSPVPNGRALSVAFMTGAKPSPSATLAGSAHSTVVTAFSDAPPSGSPMETRHNGQMNGVRSRPMLHAKLPSLQTYSSSGKPMPHTGISSGASSKADLLLSPSGGGDSASNSSSGGQIVSPTFGGPAEVLSTIDASPSAADSKSNSSNGHHEPGTPLSPIQPMSASNKDVHAEAGGMRPNPPAPSTPHRRSFSVATNLSVRVPSLTASGLIGPSPDGIVTGSAPSASALENLGVEPPGLTGTPSKCGSVLNSSPVPPPPHPFGASAARPKPTSYYSQSKYIPSNDPGTTSPHHPGLELPAPPTVFLSDGSVLLPQAESEAIASALSSQATTPRTRIGGGVGMMHLPGHTTIPSSLPMRPGLESRLSIHRRRATLDTASSSHPDGAKKVAQFEHDLALARRKVGEHHASSTKDLRSEEQTVSQSTVITVSSTPTSEDKLSSDMTFVSAAAASKSPNNFAEFFSLPIKELLHPVDDERSWVQKLTHSFLPIHPSLEDEYHLFFRARSLQLNRRAVFSVIVIIFALSFYEQVNDLESTTVSAQGLWSCHFAAFVFGIAWLWITTYRKEWYIRHLNIMTLLILCLQSIMFITVALFRDSLGTAYGTGMCLLLLSVISMASSMNFVYSVLASLIILAYYPIASLIWKGTVPGIILMLLAGTFFYVRAAWDSSYNLREIFLRKRNQVAETNLSMQLLDNMLPPHILHLMRLSEFIALAHVEADILFSDIVGFTALASLSQPIDLVAILNVMFSSFDREALEHGVYKVETIGDAYLACCGVVSHPVDHTRNLVNCGLGFQRITQKFRTGTDQRPLVIRVGIHTGPVVSGVIGKKMPRYHLFGETLIIAETMEQKGTPGRVAISEATRGNLEKLGCLNDYDLESLTSVTLYVHTNEAPGGSGPPSNRRLSGKPQSEFTETPRTRRREKIQVEMKRFLISHAEKTTREIADTMLPISNPAS